MAPGEPSRPKSPRDERKSKSPTARDDKRKSPRDKAKSPRDKKKKSPRENNENEQSPVSVMSSPKSKNRGAAKKAKSLTFLRETEETVNIDKLRDLLF